MISIEREADERVLRDHWNGKYRVLRSRGSIRQRNYGIVQEKRAFHRAQRARQ
jgi:hypothetical protein